MRNFLTQYANNKHPTIVTLSHSVVHASCECSSSCSSKLDVVRLLLSSGPAPLLLRLPWIPKPTASASVGEDDDIARSESEIYSVAQY